MSYQLSLPSQGAFTQRGSALVMVLWIVAVSSVIIIGVQRMTESNLRLGRHEVERVKANWLARAGVEKGLSILSEDITYDDSTLDLWYDNPETFREDYSDEKHGTWVVHYLDYDNTDGLIERLGISDLGARINVNYASGELLLNLPNIDEEITASIEDWRDEDDDIRNSGAEAGYYSELDLPYEIRNGKIQTLDELQLIKSVKANDYHGIFGESNKHYKRLSQLRTKTDQVQDGDDLGWRFWVTPFSYEKNTNSRGQERININDADAETLKSNLGISKALADAVVKKRNENVFSSFFDLLNIKEEQQKNGQSNNNSNSTSNNETKSFTVKWLANHWLEMSLTSDKKLPGKLNVNTASRYVLERIAGLDDEIVDAIINTREGSTGPIMSMSQLLEAVGEEPFKLIADRVNLRSEVFLIVSSGRSYLGTIQRIVAVIDRGSDPYSILYWYQSES
ncbi:helix-hairpin-helix domain-containing protein [Poriferisphaera sp. WC338]|uniref:helix-hairpin-helix domain-containing protein n=1 Tax=Poriferisphaera sp. WC338 TaxID=3425129 RepID=UPI003D8142B9